MGNMCIQTNWVSHVVLISLLQFVLTSAFGQSEICNNAIDDDGDLQIDLLDSDCNCDSEAVNFDLNINRICFDNVVLSLGDDYLLEDYYQWYRNDVAMVGDTFQELVLTPNTISGRYHLIVRDSQACIVSDYYNFSSASFDYAVDVEGVQCGGSEVHLSARDSAETYMWSNGSSSQAIVVSEPGSYSLTAIYNIDGQQCEYSEIIGIEEDCSCDFENTPINLVRNGGFESITGCCFQVENNVSNCIDDWTYVGGLHYYFTNVCGVTPDVITNTTLKDFKDDGFVGFFSYGLENREFTGALSTCLTNTLVKDSLYSLRMDMAKDNFSELIPSGIMEFGIYGIPSCSDLQRVDGNEIFCNSSIQRTLLNSFDITEIGIYSFQNYEFSLDVKEDFEAIAIAPLCEHIFQENWGELLLIDNISLFQTPPPYDADIEVVSNDCVVGLVLGIISDEDLIVQWYRDTTLITGETEQVINIAPNEAGSHEYSPVIRSQNGLCQRLESHSWNPSEGLEIYDTTSLCIGAKLEWRGLVITENGTYENTHTSMACNKTTYLTVIVDDVYPVRRDTASICLGDAFQFGNITLYDAGIYRDTIMGPSECHEIVWLDLRMEDFDFEYLEVTICKNDSYQFGGLELLESGTYLDTIYRSGTCDSIIELNLSVEDIALSTLEVEICEGNSFSFDGIEIFQSGMYWDTIVKEGNCDSIVGINLVVHPFVLDTLEYTSCDVALIVLNENDTVTQSGVYIDSIYNSDGCLELEMHIIDILERITFDTIRQTISEREYFVYQSDTLTEEGVYVYGFTDENGCAAEQYVEIVFDDLSIPVGIAIPNIFSPNGDGINDRFFISVPVDEYSDLELRLYNRWGNEVYILSTSNVAGNLGWDGSFNNVRAAKGVYVYSILLERQDGRTIKMTGTVTLI